LGEGSRERKGENASAGRLGGKKGENLLEIGRKGQGEKGKKQWRNVQGVARRA